MANLDRIKKALQAAIEHEQQKRKEEGGVIFNSAMETVSKNLDAILGPYLSQLKDNARLSREEVNDIVSQAIQRYTPQNSISKSDIYEIVNEALSSLRLPEVRVSSPKVVIPKIKVPEIIMPDEMNVKGWVNLMGVDLNNPLPVQLRDAKGNPITLFENLTKVVSGGGGFKTITVGGIQSSAWGDVINPDGRLRVESLDTGSSTQPVSQVSGAIWSVNVAQQDVSQLVHQVSGASWSVSVNDSFRTTVASNLINSDDRLRVSIEGLGLTDTELRASSVPVAQVSGAIWSVQVTDAFATTIASNVVNPDNRVKVELVGTQTVSATGLDIRSLVNATDSISAYQVSGANWSVNVQDVFATTVASNVVNSDNRVKTELVGTITVDGSAVTQPVSVASTLGVSQVSGAVWSVQVTDVFATTVASTVVNPDNRVKVEMVGQFSEDAPHTSGDLGTMALTVRNSTNTTFASADGDYQPIATDGIGRPIMRPVQTRGLLQTAYLSLTTGTETTLLAGAAGTYFDLVYIMATNSSDAAVTVDLRAATGGGIITSIRIPANGTAGVSLAVPLPQDAAADTWTADMPDITGTTVTLGALFSREV